MGGMLVQARATRPDHRRGQTQAARAYAPLMPRPTHLGAAALLLTVALSARADVTPPRRASITLELTVEGQASLPDLRFFVTNCRDPVETSVLDPATPLVCDPVRGAVRIFGFRPADLNELFDLIGRDAGSAESAAFLAAKAKTCGSVGEEDVIFLAETNVAFVAARYALEPGPKGGCKLRRISAVTKTRGQLGVPASASSTPSASPAPAPAAPSGAAGAPARQPGCGCAAAPSDAPAPGLTWLTLVLGVAARRVGRRARARTRSHLSSGATRPFASR